MENDKLTNIVQIRRRKPEESLSELHTADNTTKIEQEGQIPVQESMADLQSQDPDIGPILGLRLRKSDQPRPEEVLSESEAAKVARWLTGRASD